MSVRSQIAKRLRPFVERWAPAAPVVPLGGSRYRVIRVIDGVDRVLYDGVNGADARRWWEHYRFHRERGRMEFWQNDVRRDVYEG